MCILSKYISNESNLTKHQKHNILRNRVRRFTSRCAVRIHCVQRQRGTFCGTGSFGGESHGCGCGSADSLIANHTPPTQVLPPAGEEGPPENAPRLCLPTKLLCSSAMLAAISGEFFPLRRRSLSPGLLSSSPRPQRAPLSTRSARAPPSTIPCPSDNDFTY
jgi:hypothetical protein